MAAFFSDLLDDFTDLAFLRRVQKKYHYEESHLTILQSVAEEMLPLMRGEAFWERGAFRSKEEEQRDYDARHEAVVVSLGHGLDKLQEDYDRRGMLSESYMLETLASELLFQSYSAYNQYIGKNENWHVARYHFLGSEEAFPLGMLPKMLKRLNTQITCNAACCMQPKKSVAFVAELTQDVGVRCGDICASCNSVQCPYNDKNFYQRSLL